MFLVQELAAVLTLAGLHVVDAHPPAHGKVGHNPCAWGPSFWCKNLENTQYCNMDADMCAPYCNEPALYPELAGGDVCVLLGLSDCMQGPSYWCMATQTATECQVDTQQCRQFCENPKAYPDIQEGEICALLRSPQEDRQQQAERVDLQAPTGGCESGPSYWCSSSEAAAECGKQVSACLPHCQLAALYPHLPAGPVCRKLMLPEKAA